MKLARILPIIAGIVMMYTLSATSFADEAPSLKNPPSPEPNPSDVSVTEQSSVIIEEPKVDITIQFVDENGNEVPNLFIYWEKNDHYFDYSVYTGSPTNHNGIWKYSVKPGKTRFLVRNIYSTLYQIEEWYEIDVPENGTQTSYKLTWTKRIPKQLLDETRHKLIIHFEDISGNPAIGLEVVLRKASMEKLLPGQKRNPLGSYELCSISGFTDTNGDFITNLHDDVFYDIETSDSKYSSGNDSIDATGGGTIEYTIKAS